MKSFGITLIAVAIVSIGFSNQASALPKFKKAFAEKYTDKDTNAEYFTLVKKTGCNVCHVKGEDKTERNPYGDELAKLIEGEAGARLKKAKEDGNKDTVEAKIMAELEAAWDEAAGKENEAGIKYGLLIKGGKLPVPLPKEE